MSAQVDELSARLRRATQDMWLEKPDDIKLLVGRNYHTGREFPVWVYSIGYLDALNGLLSTYQAMAKRHEGDLKTLAGLAAKQARFYSDSGGDDSEGLARIAHLYDTAALLADAADVFDSISTFEEFFELTHALQRYILQLKFWVDIEFPWKQVSEYVDSYWHDRYGGIACIGELQRNEPDISFSE